MPGLCQFTVRMVWEAGPQHDSLVCQSVKWRSETAWMIAARCAQPTSGLSPHGHATPATTGVCCIDRPWNECARDDLAGSRHRHHQPTYAIVSASSTHYRQRSHCATHRYCRVSKSEERLKLVRMLSPNPRPELATARVS